MKGQPKVREYIEELDKATYIANLVYFVLVIIWGYAVYLVIDKLL